MALVCNSSAGVASGGGERRSTRCHAPDNRYRQTNICCPVCLARRAFVAIYVDWSFPHQRSRCFASLENIGLISFHVTAMCVRSLDEWLWSMFRLDSVYFRYLYCCVLLLNPSRVHIWNSKKCSFRCRHHFVIDKIILNHRMCAEG